MYDIENLYEAKSVGDAVKLLTGHPDARIIAGGSDVLLKIRRGDLAGCDLVSIYGLDELRFVKLDGDGAVRIGPLSSFSHIHNDPLIKEHIPVLSEAVDMVGGPQIRNIGTIGGNICNGVTSADSASTLLAFDANLEYTGPQGKRIVPIKEHYLGPGKTALKQDEILTAIIIAKESYENCAGHYYKYAMRNAMDIATLGCSVNVRLSADKKTIERLRVAYGVAAPTPVRAVHAEEIAREKPISEETIKLAAGTIEGDINPRTSWRASRDLREHLAVEIFERSFRIALRKAGGQI
jgi:xanthine dehydrogenase FAD-binding subunit